MLVIGNYSYPELEYRPVTSSEYALEGTEDVNRLLKVVLEDSKSAEVYEWLLDNVFFRPTIQPSPSNVPTAAVVGVFTGFFVMIITAVLITICAMTCCYKKNHSKSFTNTFKN